MVSTANPATDDELRAFVSLVPDSPLPQPLEGDEHVLAWDGDEPAGRCSLWWRTTPMLDGAKVGYVGHFVARSREGACELLSHACRRLAENGCLRAVGPIDGNTWRRYRFVTERGDEPPFFLEPDNPDDWPAAFCESGFSKLAHYTSALEKDLHRVDPRVPEIVDRMNGLDVRVRQFDPSRFDEEVDRIFRVSVASFRTAFLYQPIDGSRCRALYEPLKPFIRAELALIAEQREEPVGFVFAIPDWAQAKRGARIDTAIVKTIAILPQPELSGLGALLLAQCRSRIAELGYTRTIHALMFDGNVGSRRLSDRFGETMRGYSLFSRDLAGLP